MGNWLSKKNRQVRVIIATSTSSSTMETMNAARLCKPFTRSNQTLDTAKGRHRIRTADSRPTGRSRLSQVGAREVPSIEIYCVLRAAKARITVVKKHALEHAHCRRARGTACRESAVGPGRNLHGPACQRGAPCEHHRAAHSRPRRADQRTAVLASGRGAFSDPGHVPWVARKREEPGCCTGSAARGMEHGHFQLSWLLGQPGTIPLCADR